jgi:asparagine synthase (glutamine-hydrolysing)
MCGIGGIVYVDSDRKVDVHLLEGMNRVQRHRGPDDAGIWTRNNAGLAQNRLSIIDLSPAGNQPMGNENGRIWITFNGEIYNYREIRTDLLAKGHQFRSQTDTEVVLHLWEERGERLVEDLRGMFALAIWDEDQQTLFLARDRFGKKPLFYAALPDRLTFGSEIKAILADQEFKIEPNLEAINYYLIYQSVPAPFCAFKGIQKLAPGHTLVFHSGRIHIQPYWQLSYREPLRIDTPKAEVDLQVELIERLREAVKIRLMSDVPLGAFLSGGIDSSIVVALMAGLIDQPVKTFSIGFTQGEYNELPYARLVADRYRTEHHEFMVTPDILAIIPELVWHYNEPFADSSAIPTYYVAKLARQYVTVVLTGDGGDENFAGYPRYQNKGEYALSAGFPNAWQRIFAPGDRFSPFVSSQRFNWSEIRRLRDLNQQRWLYYRRITHFHEGYQPHLYTPEFRRSVSGIFGVDIMLEKYRQAHVENFLDATLFTDFHLYLPDTLMAKSDIAAMTHSLEARMPFLDHRFVEFAARIPAGLKLKNGNESKYILKKAIEPYLSKELIHRPKMGFAVPLDHWLRAELKEWAYETLLSPRAIQRGYFQTWYVKFMLDRHQEGESWQYLIWNLLMLELWHQMFIDRTLAPPT